MRRGEKKQKNARKCVVSPLWPATSLRPGRGPWHPKPLPARAAGANPPSPSIVRALLLFFAECQAEHTPRKLSAEGRRNASGPTPGKSRLAPSQDWHLKGLTSHRARLPCISSLAQPPAGPRKQCHRAVNHSRGQFSELEDVPVAFWGRLQGSLNNGGHWGPSAVS